MLEGLCHTTSVGRLERTGILLQNQLHQDLAWYSHYISSALSAEQCIESKCSETLYLSKNFQRTRERIALSASIPLVTNSTGKHV